MVHRGLNKLFGLPLGESNSFPTFAIPTATKGSEKRVKNFKRKVLKRVKAVQVAETILQQLSEETEDLQR
jgi:hypothetical protein